MVFALEFVVQELDAVAQIIQSIGFDHPVDSPCLSRLSGGVHLLRSRGLLACFATSARFLYHEV